MTASAPTRLRRDASASIFVFGLAGVALTIQIVNTVLDQWLSGQFSLQIVDGQDQAMTTLVDTADISSGALLTLRGSEVVAWVGSAAVLVTLSMCVVGMLRGDVFTRATVRWAAAAGWTTIFAVLVLPTILRQLGTNMALASVDGDFSPHVNGEQFWYLYVGGMTLSFFGLVLQRGYQMRQDQAGLI